MSDPSFERFVAGSSTDLLRTAYLLTGDQGQATDLLLTGLAAARRHWTPGTGPDSGAEVARRAMVASHTGWQRRLELGHLLADSPLLAGMSGLPGFASPTADRGRRSGTSAALARLPARTRAALVLRYGEGLSEPAAAELLGCSAEDVAAETGRGLATLRADETGTTDVESRLRHDLAEQAAEVTAAPGGVTGLVQERDRGDRRHLVGLLALLAFAVAVVLLVLFSLR